MVVGTRAPSETAVALTPGHVRTAARDLETASPHEIVGWAVDTFGPQLCLTTSFADTVLVHLATQVRPDLDVIFLDTGFHFAETLETMRAAFARYSLNLTVVRPDRAAEDLWTSGVTACCDTRKVAPLAKAMRQGGFTAWMSGLRRSDHPGRAAAPIVERDRNGRTKVNPIATWTDADVADYIAAHDLIVNPLTRQGYGSIGCWPCTEAGEGRDGRWSESTKTECGLHL